MNLFWLFLHASVMISFTLFCYQLSARMTHATGAAAFPPLLDENMLSWQPPEKNIASYYISSRIMQLPACKAALMSGCSCPVTVPFGAFLSYHFHLSFWRNEVNSGRQKCNSQVFCGILSWRWSHVTLSHPVWNRMTPHSWGSWYLCFPDVKQTLILHDYYDVSKVTVLFGKGMNYFIHSGLFIENLGYETLIGMYKYFKISHRSLQIFNTA